MGPEHFETALEVMRRIAVVNMEAEERVFTTKALAKHPGAWAAWEMLLDKRSERPLIKTLEVEADDRPGLFQFKHISFQEALYATELSASALTWSGREVERFLTNPFMLNTCRIGGSPLLSSMANRVDSARNLLGKGVSVEAALELAKVSKEKNISLCGIKPGQRQVDLSSKGLTHADAILIAAYVAMRLLRSLELLNLGGNQIGDVGMQAFADAIGSGSMANLESLDISDNKIGDPGLISLSEALAKGSLRALEFLDLGNNQIGNVGMIEFSRSIPIGLLGALTYLRLSGNQIGDAGMIEFSRSIANGSMGKLTVYCSTLRNTLI